MAVLWKVLVRIFLASLLSLIAGTRSDAANPPQLNLMWMDSANNEEGFKIQRTKTEDGTVDFIRTGANLGGGETSYPDTGVLASNEYCYQVLAFNTAGESAYSNPACGTATVDDQAPTVFLTAPAEGSMVVGSSVTVSASASDNVGVVGVQFLLNGAPRGNEDSTAPYSLAWDTTTTTNGSYSIVAMARDATGNQTASTAVTVTVDNQTPPLPPPPDPSGLVAAYSFDEGSGSTVADASNNANVGTISGATWSTQGKFDAGLSFDGVNDWVTINDANSLDLSDEMTLEAWVYPTTSLSGWRGVIQKEQAGGIVYYLHASSEANQPVMGVFIGGEQSLQGGSRLGANTWTHLAATYDGSQQRLYVNGVEVASRAQSGVMATSSGAVRIGGNSVWGEYFQGRVDNVRIYNRALTASQVRANMTIPVGTPPPPPPPPPTFTFTVTKAGDGSGTVSGSGIACGTDCAQIYDENTQVTLGATAAGTSTFGGWSGDCDVNGQVQMSADKTCTATFTLLPPPPLPTYSLTVTKAGNGSGTVGGPGIACGADCAQIYDENTQVTLVATAAGTSMFVGWSGDCDGQGMVSMTADKTCTASFELLPPPPPPDPTASNVRIGIFRPSTGEWFLDLNGNGFFDDCSEDGCVVSFGEPDEVPVVGDWDGSGVTRIGVFNPNTRLWKLDRNADDIWEGGVDLLVGPFGQAGDRAVVGDWTGSGTTTIGVKRNRGKWWLDVNGNGQWDGCDVDSCPRMGENYLPVAGDWTGSGTDKVGFFRFNGKGQGIWQLDADGNGVWNNTLDLTLKPFGQTGDLPIVGDWTGSGTTQIGVFDPATGLWELDLNGNGKWDGCEVDVCLGPFGQTGDIPMVGKW